MLRWLIAWALGRYAWECVYFSGTVEVERNNLTTQYRHRSIRYGSGTIEEGLWIPGMPDARLSDITLDDLLSTEEMAKRLAPMRKD